MADAWGREKESEIVRQISDYLTARRVFWWRDASGHTHGRKLNGKRGIADILAIYRGKPLAIEVKRKDGALSVTQFNWLESFRSAGGVVIVATSVEDVQQGLGGIHESA